MGRTSNLARYLRVFRRHAGSRVYVILILTFLSGLSEGFGIMLLLPLLATVDAKSIDLPGAPALMNDLAEWVGVAGSLPGILSLIGFMFLVKGFLKFCAEAYAGKLQASLIESITQSFLDAIANAHYLVVTRKTNGNLASLLTSQVNQFYLAFGAYVGFISQVVTAICYAGLALLVAWQFGVMALAMGVMLLFLFNGLNTRTRKLSDKAADEETRRSSLLIELLDSYKYLSATNSIAFMRSKLTSSVRRLVSYETRQLVWRSLTGTVAEPVVVFLIILIIIVQLVALKQPLAPLLVSIVLFNRGLASVMVVQRTWQYFLSQAGSVSLIDRELEILQQNQGAHGTEPAPALTEGITFDNVSFRYQPSAPQILRSLNANFPANTVTAVVGRSGSGKSTIVDMICLLLRPNSGTIFIDGIDAERISVPSWRSKIGYVCQELVVFEDTIFNNIALSVGDISKDPHCAERVRNATKQAHLDQYIESLPNQYQTVIGERGTRLSGGQKQRLFIAREMYKNPCLLVLDEASSALDSESEQAVQASINQLKGAVTIVVIAHRLSTIKGADNILVIEDGIVVEQGSYEQLRSQSNSRLSTFISLQTL